MHSEAWLGNVLVYVNWRPSISILHFFRVWQLQVRYCTLDWHVYIEGQSHDYLQISENYETFLNDYKTSLGVMYKGHFNPKSSFYPLRLDKSHTEHAYVWYLMFVLR